MFKRLLNQIYNSLSMVATVKRRRSEKLSADLRKALRKYVNDQPTITDAAESLEMGRGTLNSILKGGTASTETILKLQTKLNVQ